MGDLNAACNHTAKFTECIRETLISTVLGTGLSVEDIDSSKNRQVLFLHLWLNLFCHKAWVLATSWNLFCHNVWVLAANLWANTFFPRSGSPREMCQAIVGG